MSMLFRHERRQADERVAEASVRYGGISGRRVGALFAIAAVVVVTAAMWLPTIGDRMGEAMGWNESFVGTLFVAFATSAPELVVTLAAVRIGAIDLAIGNVLGSNLFNMAEVGLLDPLYRKGPLLTDVSASHAATAFTAVMMSGLVVVGLFYRPGRRVLRTVGWVSIVLAGLFLLNSFFVYYAQ
jgi:cation:H+ antiporter